jgi:hypothetical protein
VIGEGGIALDKMGIVGGITKSAASPASVCENSRHIRKCAAAWACGIHSAAFSMVAW